MASRHAWKEVESLILKVSSICNRSEVGSGDTGVAFPFETEGGVSPETEESVDAGEMVWVETSD